MADSRFPPELVIRTLRGGLNENESPVALQDDQCVVVENMDFDRSPLGGRRRGQTPLTSLTGNTLSTECFFLFRHLPSDDQTASELWAVSHSAGPTFTINRKTTAWSAITPHNALASGARYRIEAQSLHGKMFFAAPLSGSLDRMLVWDGSGLRKAGFISNADDGSVANTGAGAYAAVARYYRIRYTEQVSGVTIRRSEPVNVATFPFTPSGTGTAARVTIGTLPGESETHWELEASADNTNFYRIATTVVGTTTYDDSATPSTYATTGTLSETIGDYIPLPAAKYLAADEDRLLMAGHWVTAAYRSRVWWTPVFGATGVGNDERIPTQTNNYLDLDNFDGGEITDLAGPLYGSIYAFKHGHIYKLIRRGVTNRAYEAVLLTNRVGALPRSVLEGFDEAGRPCLYFLDPHLGPMMLGVNGIERCGADISGSRTTTWSRVNQNASVVCHGLFYSDINQVEWWLSVDGATLPNLCVVGYTKSFERTREGIRRGWGHHTGGKAAALCAILYADNIDDNTARSLKLKPLYGIASGTASKLIQKGETGNQDDGTNYRAYQKTKPFVLGDLLRKVGVMMGMVMAKASSGVTITLNLIRDFGVESLSKTVDLTAAGSEDPVVKTFEVSTLSQLQAFQFELGDGSAQNVDWSLDLLALKLRHEEKK